MKRCVRSSGGGPTVVRGIRITARGVLARHGYASEGNASYLWRRLSKAGLVPSSTSSAN